MKLQVKRAGLTSLLAACLAVGMPATMALAGTQSNVNVSTVTDAFSERNLFTDHLEKARQEILVGKYDEATMHANEARRWFLAFADSVALEKPSYSWDNVRDLETDLVATYMDLGRLYHISGRYQNAVNVLAASLSVNPYQPEARYQQMLAYVALQDANDNDIDANDIDRIEIDLDRINRMDDLDNNGIIDVWEDIDQDGIKDHVDPMIDSDRDGISDMDDDDIHLHLPNSSD
ncbi:MAG: hypothetical protein ACAI44_14835 [Candidatus Sericytochromatia bacterium]